MQLVAPNDPILSRPAAAVQFPDKNLSRNIANMLHMMIANQGCGLAAPQVGLDARMLIFSWNGRAGTLINPEIVYKSSELVEAQEGCLTFPGLYWKTKRARDIRINYQNFNGDKIVDEVIDGFLAVIVQHEVDHLNGILLTQHGSLLPTR